MALARVTGTLSQNCYWVRKDRIALPRGVNHVAFVTAVNTSHLESMPSAELIFQVDELGNLVRPEMPGARRFLPEELPRLLCRNEHSTIHNPFLNKPTDPIFGRASVPSAGATPTTAKGKTAVTFIAPKCEIPRELSGLR